MQRLLADGLDVCLHLHMSLPWQFDRAHAWGWSSTTLCLPDAAARLNRSDQNNISQTIDSSPLWLACILLHSKCTLLPTEQ